MNKILLILISVIILSACPLHALRVTNNSDRDDIKFIIAIHPDDRTLPAVFREEIYPEPHRVTNLKLKNVDQKVKIWFEDHPGKDLTAMFYVRDVSGPFARCHQITIINPVYLNAVTNAKIAFSKDSCTIQ